jgi:hypothetical protein
MKKFTKYIPILIMLISSLVSASQTMTTEIRRANSPTYADSCNLKQYLFYSDTLVEDGLTYGPADFARMGCYFPIDDVTTGVIKSVDMCFSSNSATSAQSCIVYFYKADQTTIFGQSPAFINTAPAWPEYTWLNVPCPDIPFTGPFYAMVDYSILARPDKNFFCGTCTGAPIPGYPLGNSFLDDGGVWYNSWAFDCPFTFFQRINVCEVDPVGITTLSPSTISIYPNPANNFVNVVSIDVISKIELLDFMGQTIYTSDNVNRKSFKLDVNSFKSGSYFIKVTSRSRSQMTKISVLH